jgi:hypothetical protein
MTTTVAIAAGTSIVAATGISLDDETGETGGLPPVSSSLYPYSFLDPVTAMNGPNLLPSGSLVLMSIDMTTTQMTRIIITQVSLTQDFGMRYWLSQYPAGVSVIGSSPHELAVSRMSPMPLIIYNVGQTPSDDRASLAQVMPGIYYLNVLNLTNCPAVFLFSTTDLA